MPELLKEGDKVIIVSQPEYLTIDLVGKTGTVEIAMGDHLPYAVNAQELKIGYWYLRRDNLELIKKPSALGCKVKQQAA